MTRRLILCLAVLSLAACSGGFGSGNGLFGGRDQAEPVAAPMDAPPTDDAVPAVGSAGAAEDEGRFLGFTVTSLGDASRPGLWLETPLVTEEGPGRVVSENGRQLTLTLIPSGGDRGAGSSLSLAGFQELGLDLTSLPTLTVISDA